MFEPATLDCFALFENTRDPAAPARLYRSPVRHLVAREPQEVLFVLKAIQEAQNEGLHACGYVSYEAGYALNRLPLPDFALSKVAEQTPLAHFALFEQCEWLSAEDLATAFADLEPSGVFDLQLAETEEAYTAKITAIKAAIARGETYQVNYTLPCHFRFGGSPLSLYSSLRKTQPVPYSAFLQLGDEGAHEALLSLSPELFLAREGNTLKTRPMKGTAPRADQPEVDAAIARSLTEDSKSRAENLMIVDLLRNDLGRVAQTGSVQVTQLFEIETYATLHQMTSSIEAQLRPDVGLAEIFASLFPCGSVTGAPKRHTMKLIADLEGQPRGVYTGAIGYVEPNGDFCFNVPIRTVRCPSAHTAVMGVGSGIVHDSSAAAEYAEVQLKTRFLAAINHDLYLIESMQLLADGSVPRLGLHLERLQQSTKALGFKCDPGTLCSEIEAAAQRLRNEHPQRLRLALYANGEIALSAHAIPPLPEQPTVLISPQRISSEDPLRQHKTSARTLYESEYNRAVAVGAYEVLFFNEKGALVEAARHNVFVENDDGLLLTPPLSAGALPGVLRRTLLESGQAIEKPLDMLDLKKGKKVLIGNAVRCLNKVNVVF